MQEFSIREVERLSGIKAHTLRIWEHRYGLAVPHRKESSHRYYTNDDLREILRVVWLYRQGHKISSIARLDKKAVASLIGEAIDSRQFTEDAIERLTTAARMFDDTAFSRQLQMAYLQLGVEHAIQEVVFPYLQRVGLLWMNDQLLPAQEHFGSQLIRNSLIYEIDRLQPEAADSGIRVLLFTPMGEHHEIPLLFVQYLLKKYGHTPVYMGLNCDIDTIAYYMEHKPAAFAWFHLITNFTDYPATEYLTAVCEKLHPVQVFMSGPLHTTIEKCPSNGRLVTSPEELLQTACHPQLSGLQPS